MKKYSYNLFPIPLLILGYVCIFISIIGLILAFSSVMTEKSYKDIGSYAPFIFIGLVLITFRSSIIVDNNSDFVIKESRMFGMKLSRERVKIPRNCNGLIIKQKIKEGTGYYRAVIPVKYQIKSCDMFFYSDKGIVRLINTDYERSIKIADLIKDNLNINYIFE